jgi:hypothetical protein
MHQQETQEGARPLPLQAKGHLLPDFYSGATGLSGRFY